MKENKDSDESAVRVISSKTATDIRLLVLDIDGTIIDDSNRIRDSVAQAIASAKRRGVAVAIATGRLYQNSLHAHNSIGSTLPLICNEGALIREPKTEVVHRHWPLERRAVAQVLDYTEQPSLNDRVSVQFYVQHDLYISNLNEASIKFFQGSKVAPIVVSDLRQLLDRAITEVIVLSDEFEVIARLAGLMNHSHSRIRVKEYKSMAFLKIFHPAVNKRLAVSYLAQEIMSLRPENVMAIGDDFADIEMLQYAGIGVAMGHAPLEVRAAADWVTTTFEEDGAARAIDKWILQPTQASRSS
ncbi:MAG TPA: Cof-type HAD-IIB family hydrolase [Pyrinomonadaceae bacterium]|nr:Cof-type HAD-IIB family hydrolase [Pyrinomonadaceae bacterium]